MDDRQKYLKYKKKYTELKERAKQRMLGGHNGKFPVQDEIFFWSRQLMEHQLFLNLGLEDAEHVLKDEAFALYREWRDYIKINFVDKGIKLEPDLVFLSPEQIAKVGQLDTNVVSALIDKTMVYLNKVIGILDTNVWIGWIFPSLAHHMKKETEYFKRKLSGPAFTVDEEIKFINDHHTEELATTAHLLDPAPENDETFEKVMSFAKKTMPDWTEEDKKILKGLDVTEQATYLYLSIKYGKEIVAAAEELGGKIDAKAIKTIISPTLAHHAGREFIRFTKTLEMLKK